MDNIFECFHLRRSLTIFGSLKSTITKLAAQEAQQAKDRSLAQVVMQELLTGRKKLV